MGGRLVFELDNWDQNAASSIFTALVVLCFLDLSIHSHHVFFLPTTTKRHHSKKDIQTTQHA